MRVTRGWKTVLVAALLGVVGCVGVGWAQNADPNTVMIRYDVDSTTATACRVEGRMTSTTLGGQPGAGRVKTTGSSATVESETAASGALTPVVARDILFVRPAAGSTTEPFGAGFAAVILSKADNDTVTVDPAVNWSAVFNYTYLRPVCGTTANDGWVAVDGADRVSLSIQYDQGDLDNLSWRFECKHATPGSVPVTVYPSEGDTCGTAGTLASGFCDFATASATANFTWHESGVWGSCRILFKAKTTDASDAGANLERVTGSISVSRRQ